MMRSMTASMASSGLISDKFAGFELCDRIVGELELVEFAGVEQLHDDVEQPVARHEIVGDGAGAAKIVRGDGVGVAHHLRIHAPHSALDQHGLKPPLRTDNAGWRELVPIQEGDFLCAALKSDNHYRICALFGMNRYPLLRIMLSLLGHDLFGEPVIHFSGSCSKKQKRTGPEKSGRCAPGKFRRDGPPV